MVGLLGEPAGFAEAFAGATGERIAEIGAAFFGEGLETLNDLGVGGGDVSGLAGIAGEFEERGRGEENGFVVERPAVEGAVAVGEGARLGRGGRVGDLALLFGVGLGPGHFLTGGLRLGGRRRESGA